MFETAAVIPAERSPSEISRMRAPVLRISSISFSWRGRSRTIIDQILHLAVEPLRDRFQVVCHRRVEVDRALARRADDDLLHVEVGRMQQAAVLARGQHGDRVRLARGAEIGALERVDGDIHRGVLSGSYRGRPRRLFRR